MQFRPSHYSHGNPGIRAGAGSPTGQYYVTLMGERGATPDGWHWGTLEGRVPSMVKIKGPLVPGQRVQFKRLTGNTATQWAILRDRQVMPQHEGATGMPGPGMVGFDAYSMHPGVRVIVPPARPNPSWDNITTKSGVVLTDSMVEFLDALDQLLSFPVVITSGLRSVSDQASAMWTKITGGDDLYDLYSQKDLIGEVMSSASSKSAIRAVIAEQVNRGRYLSDHMRGNAVDIRSRDLSSSQKATVMALADELGAKPVDETTSASPHIHVEDVGDLDLAALVKNYWWLVAAALIGGTALVWAIKRRRAA